MAHPGNRKTNLIVYSVHVFVERGESYGHSLAVELGEGHVIFALSHGALQQALPTRVCRISGPVFASDDQEWGECKEGSGERGGEGGRCV